MWNTDLLRECKTEAPCTKPIRIAVIGTGNVGSTFAYTLLLSGLVQEIVLVDEHHDKAEGEAMDLNHAVPFTHPTRVWAGDYADCAGAVLTVLCAGVAQTTGESRLDLVNRNAAVFRSVIPQVVCNNPDGLLLVTTNPVDVLTYTALRVSGLPANRVIGSGTVLDTSRFRHLLSQHFGVDPHSVHASIIGEHGDSEVPVWSLANIAGIPLHRFRAPDNEPADQADLDRIFRETRDAAYRIVELKGATYYAIGAGLLRIVEAIVRDQRTVLPVSSLIDGYLGIHDVCLSMPAVICRTGVERILELPLAEQERAALLYSAGVLRETAGNVLTSSSQEQRTR